MDDQLNKILQDKILVALEGPSPEFTRRDAQLPLIKGKAFAVIGMRGAGKTTFLHQCRADLLAAGRSPHRLLYFSFEDERLGGLEASQLGEIVATLLRLFPEPAEETITLFLDEIQLVPGWESFVRRLLDTPGYELFLSGSSVKLLSTEIATSMRGPTWEIAIHPFGFGEFLRHANLALSAGALSVKKSAFLDHHFSSYLNIGGFPEAQGLPLPQRRQLLQGYVDVLLLRDVIERHEVSNVTALRWMVRRLLSSPAGLFSVTKFAEELKAQGIAVGRDTLYELLDHLEDAFLLHTIPIASDSEKRRQVNPRKVYPADPGLIPVFDRSGRANLGHALETSVYIELLRRGAEVAYVKTSKGYEVDFRARYPDGKVEFIQVCASIDHPKMLSREVRALEDLTEASPQTKKLLLTAESRLPFPETPEEIQVLPAWEWMLAHQEHGCSE